MMQTGESYLQFPKQRDRLIREEEKNGTATRGEQAQVPLSSSSISEAFQGVRGSVEALASPRQSRKRSISLSPKKSQLSQFSPVQGRRKRTDLEKPEKMPAVRSDSELEEILEEAQKREEEEQRALKTNIGHQKEEKKTQETVIQNPLRRKLSAGGLDLEGIRKIHYSKKGATPDTIIAAHSDSRCFENESRLVLSLGKMSQEIPNLFPKVRELKMKVRDFWLNLQTEPGGDIFEHFQSTVLVPNSVAYFNRLKSCFYQIKQEEKRKAGAILSPLFDKLEQVFDLLGKTDACLSKAEKRAPTEVMNYHQVMNIHSILYNHKFNRDIRHIFGRLVPKTGTLFSYLQAWDIPSAIPFKENTHDPDLFRRIMPKSALETLTRNDTVLPTLYFNNKLIFRSYEEKDEATILLELFKEIHLYYKRGAQEYFKSDDEKAILRAQVKLFRLFDKDNSETWIDFPESEGQEEGEKKLVSFKDRYFELMTAKKAHVEKIKELFNRFEEFRDCPIDWEKLDLARFKNEDRPFGVLRELIPAFTVLQLVAVTSGKKVKNAFCKKMEDEHYGFRFLMRTDEDAVNVWNIQTIKDEISVEKTLQVGVYPMQERKDNEPVAATHLKLGTFFLNFRINSKTTRSLLYQNGEISCLRLELTPLALTPEYRQIVFKLIKKLRKLPKGIDNSIPPMKIVLADSNKEKHQIG